VTAKQTGARVRAAESWTATVICHGLDRVNLDLMAEVQRLQEENRRLRRLSTTLMDMDIVG
jgi:hypothetical protein